MKVHLRKDISGPENKSRRQIIWTNKIGTSKKTRDCMRYILPRRKWKKDGNKKKKKSSKHLQENPKVSKRKLLWLMLKERNMKKHYKRRVIHQSCIRAMKRKRKIKESTQKRQSKKTQMNRRLKSKKDNLFRKKLRFQLRELMMRFKKAQKLKWKNLWVIWMTWNITAIRKAVMQEERVQRKTKKLSMPAT